MFPNINDQAERLDALAHVVLSKALPVGNKRQHHRQLKELGNIMDLRAGNGMYDEDLDRFFQFLCVLSVGQNALDEHLAAAFPERADLARQIAQKDFKDSGRCW